MPASKVAAAEPARDAVAALPMSSSQPLDAKTAATFGDRFGFDFGDVRIHADSSATGAADRLGARAFTLANHVFFSRGAYEPSSSRGMELLAHELTHVAQQSTGSTASPEAQERQADAAERGATPAFGRAGTMLPQLRLKGSSVVSLTLTLGAGGKGASFTAVTDTGATLTAFGSAIGLSAGYYNVKLSRGTVLVIESIHGGVIPETSRFDIPWTPKNAAFIRAFAETQATIPFTVEEGFAAFDQAEPSPAGGGDPDRAAFESLPDHVRNFLVDPDAKGGVKTDYPTLLRIARHIIDLTPAELAEYRARTKGDAASLAEFEKSVAAWARHVGQRAKVERENEDATNALFGLDTIYEMYRNGWLSKNLMSSSVPGFIQDWERTPTGQLPLTHEGELSTLYLRMRRSLQRYNFANLAAFELAISRFIISFRESAYFIGLELLDKFEHTLREQEKRYDASGVAALHTSLAPARKTYEEAERYKTEMHQKHGGWGDINEFYAAGRQYQEMKAKGEKQVASQSGAHPLLGAQDFPRESIGTASEKKVGQLVKGYIAEHLEKVADTRKRLDADHEMIFKLDLLVAQAKARRGITPNSIWSKIIQDHNAPTVGEAVLEVAVVVLALALAILSGGSALAAVASLGLSSVLAVQQYQDYAMKSDAYGAQLLSDEPWLGWVVIAIVGVGLEFAAVSAVIKPIRPALREFQAGKIDLATLEQRLGGVEEKIRRSILARARIEEQARAGWTSILPKGAMFASIGIEQILGPIVYAVYINLRRGINSFNKWRLTREAIDLVGDFAKLAPADLQRLTSVYKQAVADAQRIATAGRKAGMAESEIEAALQTWAKRGSGTADDVIKAMARTPEQERALAALAARKREVKELYDVKSAIEEELTVARRELAELRAQKANPKAIREKVLEVGSLERELDKFAPGKGKIASAEARLTEAEAEAAKSQLTLYDRLRAVAPSSKAREQALKGISVDQVGALKTKPTKLEADHVVSVREISDMEGFANIKRFEDQKAIIDAADNLIAMDGAANASKGSRSWRSWPQAGNYYDQATIARMSKLESEVRAKIQDRIRDALAKQGAP